MNIAMKVASMNNVIYELADNNQFISGTDLLQNQVQKNKVL
jgi:hypothetical protein